MTDIGDERARGGKADWRQMMEAKQQRE